MAVLKAVQDGRLSLDEDVNKYPHVVASAGFGTHGAGLGQRCAGC